MNQRLWLRWEAAGPLAAIISAAVATGCASSPSEPAPSKPELVIVAGSGIADTALASPAQALRIRVRDQHGELRPGIQVELAAVFTEDEALVFVGDPRTENRAGAASLRTDQRGEALAALRFGTRTGPAAIAISVPEAGMVDTARYTVTPGNLARVSLTPHDTALYIAGTFTIHPRTLDQYGNLRTDVPSIATAGSDGVVDIRGGVVIGQALGLGSVIGTAGAFRDTVRVSVVPRGAIAAYRATFGSERPAFVISNLDGSGFRELDSLALDGVMADWDHAGQHLIVARERQSQLLRVDPATGATVGIPLGGLTVNTVSWPQVSQDGEWIYFGGGDDSQHDGLWRVRGDGTGASAVVPFDQFGSVDAFPSPSPDGRSLAFFSTRAPYGAIRILDLATRQIAVLNAYGAPRWSPLGDRLAVIALEGSGPVLSNPYNHGALVVMRPDGSGSRVVGGPGDYRRGFDWSGDGKYLIAAGNDPEPRLQVIDVDGGRRFVLPYTRLWENPTWKP